MTLRRGSQGAEVKRLQKLLGIAQDGIFGSYTEKAVREVQLRAGLSVDGVVGTKTWELLEASSKDGISITNKPINAHITASKNRPIKYIAIHYTAGSTSKKGTALATRNAFLSLNASADFVVDDETIVQVNPDLRNYYCWAVGDAKNVYSGGGRLYKQAVNRNTISIEICSNLLHGASFKYANHKGWYFTDASLNNALKLVRYLMDKFNIPKSNVVRHYDISGKLCPGILGWNNAAICDMNGKATSEKNNSKEWEDFWKKI